MSEETKHTPAPWRIAQLNLEGLHPNDGSNSILAGDIGICSVEARSPFKRGEGNRHICAERDANARLIVAAPDLLQMLKVAQLWLDVDGRYDMQGINAAISKAEGRFE